MPQNQHQFAQVTGPNIQRSSFDRSHGYKTAFNVADLIPIFLDEALPGDTFNLRMSAFGRLATPIHPIMDNIYVDTQFFAIPYRLVWDNWEKFNGAQDNPADSTDFLIPQMVAPAGGYLENSLMDYMGLPTQVAGITHSALFTRAYSLVYNQWYRDENLQDSVIVDTGDGPDTDTNYIIRKRGKRHDYFTSGLPWPQKGPAVPLPIGDTAPVLGIGIGTSPGAASGQSVRETGTPTATNFTGWDYTSSGAKFEQDPDNAGYPFVRADLASATGATINALRQAFQIQIVYEKDARGGTRYTELLKVHFGVTSADQRLQRAEYLGGGSSAININPVAQTSETSGVTPQGNLAAVGTLGLSGHGFTKSFTEHCLILGLASVRADLNYQQGLNRMWSRSTRWDFYWPSFANLGEQTILNQELYAQGTAGGTDDTEVFAYQERFAEYRFKPSQITGAMRSNGGTPLDTWHLAQDFAALPALNSDFIEENPPIARVIAVPTEPHLLLDCHFNFRCARPMPLFSIPGMMDRF